VLQPTDPAVTWLSWLMAVSPDYLAYVIEQLASFSNVTARRMFGGIGLYAEGVFFGLIDDDTLYFKVDDSNRAEYQDRGCKPFRPIKNDPAAYSMSYFEVPPDILEESEGLVRWAAKAYQVGLKATASKRMKSAPKPK
jgi:DNA transformation protein and related proteins